MCFLPLVRGDGVGDVIVRYVIVNIDIRVVVSAVISIGGIIMVDARHGWQWTVVGSVGVMVLVAGGGCVPSHDDSSTLSFFSCASSVGILVSRDASIWNILVCCAAAAACITLSFAIC